MDNVEVESAERAESVHSAVKSCSPDSQGMAVRQHQPSDPNMIDLKTDLGLDLPPTDVTVERTGTRGAWVLEITRTHKWTVEGAGSTGEVTAVYGDGRSVPLPERVPVWLLRVCKHFGVDELAI